MKKAPKRANLANLKLALSYCHVSRVLRPFLRRRPTFLAILVVEIEGMAGFFELATETVFERRRRTVDSNVSLLVKKISPGRTSHDQIFATAQSGSRFVVLIFASEADVPPHYRTAADLYKVVERFDESLMSGAVYQICRARITSEEASYLLQLPLERSTAAFRRGRSGRRSLQLLHRADNENVGHREGKIREPATIGMDSVHGYGKAQAWGLTLIKDLKSYIAGRLDWKDIDPGLLLSGPSGTGKTRYAQLLAESAGLPLIRSSASAWQAAGHLGDMLREMRASFREAVENSPSVLLIDEMDSIGDRKQLKGDYQDYTRQVINALLECLDGALARPGVIVVATTNFPDHIDEALLRPGRMDQHIALELPDADARLGILHQYLGIQLEGEAAHHVAELTDGWSGARLDKLARYARRRARELDRDVIAEDVIESMPDSIIMSPERLRTTAIHECGHALVATLLGVKLGGIRIIDRFDRDADEVSLGTVEYIRDRQDRRTRTYFLDEICILLAGVAAELEIVGDHDDGAGGTARADLTIATKLATMVECSFGMGRSLISEEMSEQELSIYRLRDPVARKTIDELLAEQMRRSREIIKFNRETLEELAAIIVKRKRMSGDELGAFFQAPGKQIVQPPLGPQAHGGGLVP